MRRGDGTDLRIRRKLVSGHKVGRQDDLDVVLLGLFHQRVDLLGSVFVVEGITDAHSVQDLLEGERHSAADNEGVDLRASEADATTNNQRKISTCIRDIRGKPD